MLERPRRVTLRVRMVALATVAVAVVLVVGGLVLAAGVRWLLVGQAIDAAQTRAEELGALAETGQLPAQIPVAGQDEALVQVVVDGQVLVSSANIEGEQPLPIADPPRGTRTQQRLSSLPIGEDHYEIVSLGIATPSGDGAVHVAASIGDIDDLVGTVIRVGLLGMPVLLAALGLMLWFVVGRTLRPIEAIRRESDEIGSEDLSRRVPEPEVDDEVGRLARTVNRMLARIEDGVRRQRRFVGDAAHELRTPIASLRTQLETARASTSAVDWDDVSSDLLDETLRMQRLTEQLLALARIDATGLGGHLVDVDLDDLVLVTAASLVVSPGTTLVTGAVQPVQIRGEPVLLRQLVQNLLDNAVRHARRTVSVELAWDGDHATLVVQDDGPGIPEGARTQVLDRFTRVDGARDRSHGGAGLGLALVADIAQAHGGTVAIADAPDLGGARIEIVLPR